ncbi:Peptidase M16 domain protein [Candidatus Zixiibacteriota bacterium]|nr:Peptidase M16 domain protein [candidate division Zixibacteria bacterium]
MKYISLRKWGYWALLMIAMTAFFLPAQSDDIVAHPDQLKFKDLNYQPPKAAEYRHTLQCGATAYIIENHETPAFNLTVMVRTGSIYEPVEKAGLADMTGYLMRNGGVTGMTAKQIDERLAYLAGDISVRIDDTRGTASLFCLSKDIDEGMGLFKKILKDPVFDTAALSRYRTDVLSELSQRNASTEDIERREWQFLMYGNHPCTTPLRRTEKSINSITRDDMLAFQKKYFFPKNFILAVSGDFKTADIISKLSALFSGWPSHELQLPPVPDQIPDPKPGVYIVEKADVNQSRIRLGHIGVKRDIPEQYALMVANDILGGGGFTSRIVSRVRSDEGLAYNAGSAFDRPVLYPGTFRAWFQTKHATAAFGTRLIVDEIKRIRTEKCDTTVVNDSKSGFIGNLVNPFSSKTSIVSTFADDQYTGRPDDYWQNYTKNIQAVTPDDVLAAAQKYLHPDKLVFLIIGNADEIKKGSDKHPENIADFGNITILPLPDPMTLEVKP